jgi:uncharacterized protein YuzE
MRGTYDPASDAMYLYLTERGAGHPEVARTEEIADVVLDLDGDGRVIGIEIFSVSKLPGAKPMQLAFEILTRSDAAAADRS